MTECALRFIKDQIWWRIKRQMRNITPLKEHNRSLYFVHQLMTALLKKQNAPITPVRFGNLLNAWVPPPQKKTTMYQKKPVKPTLLVIAG